MSFYHPRYINLPAAGILAFNLLAALPSTALVLRVFNPTDHLRMNGYPANPSINPSFLNPGGGASTRLDLTGVGWSVEDPTKQFTLVSPRHFVGANHFRPGVGSSVRFLAADNSLHTATISAIHTIPNADNTPSDVFLGEFINDLPAAAAVLPLPYLNLATEANYVGEALVVVGQAARGGRGTIGTVSDFGGDPLTGGAGIKTRALTFSYGSAGFADDCRAEGGDSGGPSFAIRPGKAALVGTHTAILSAFGTTTTYDTLVPHYVPQLNALMESTGLHMRKIDPPATSFTAAGAPTGAPARTGKPFTYRFTVTNGSAAADNVTANFVLPAGLAISGVAAVGWQSTGASGFRRGGLAAGESSQIDVTFASAPDPGTLGISLGMKSDGSVIQNFQFQITVLPSFAGWAAGLDDAGLTGDSDHDGISNLLEYAFGGDNRSNSQRFPGGGPEDTLLPVLASNSPSLTFFRRTDAAARGLVYQIETSPNLDQTGWQTLTSVPQSASAAPTTGFEKVVATLPAANGSKAFFRLRIELAE